MIKGFIDKKLDSVELKMSLRIFKDRTLSFFQTISYPDILSFLTLETPLNIIYTFLFGLNSCRTINLFKSTTSAFRALAREETARNKNLTSIAVIASLAVLKKIVKLN